eukprot:gnl/TRDRNA2_/TRDRNA2_40483_c0_seq1.p1 gnl/TRDRNA2_/TRDRNA2_40483_c0~~gnl/TRDRNA2_/TRDRNA2_40483_c0_seq1.p1  ORF type:complete len:515 (-),score=93.25 gnl/TRDRNA2_/TRDRNA2_40483_c0_seq1:58-1602(-)
MRAADILPPLSHPRSKLKHSNSMPTLFAKCGPAVVDYVMYEAQRCTELQSSLLASHWARMARPQSSGTLTRPRRLSPLPLPRKQGPLTRSESLARWAHPTPVKSPGLGAEDAPGFPADQCPGELPDLTGYYSTMAEVLKKDPSIYMRLKGKKTKGGASLAKCMKPGMDNRGHRLVKACGAVAGDADCYKVFEDFFDPIIAVHHPGFLNQAMPRHPDDGLNPDLVEVPAGGIDPSGGKCLLSSRIFAQRNLANFSFLPCIGSEDRNQVEEVFHRVFTRLPKDMQGEYFPLACPTGFRGMSKDEEASLEKEGLHFKAPNTPMLLSTGVGRNWPQGRGIFVHPSRNLAAWVNEEDHMRLMVSGPSPDVKQVFARFCQAEGIIRNALKRDGFEYARKERLGYITSSPVNLGTAMRVSFILRLPRLSQEGTMKTICRSLGVTCKLQETEGASQDIWEIAASSQLGLSEAQLVSRAADACRKVVEAEISLGKPSTPSEPVSPVGAKSPKSPPKSPSRGKQ